MSAQPKRSKKEPLPAVAPRKGLFDLRVGIRIVAVISILLAVFETWQISSFKSPLESVLWGLFFGASIWVVAVIYYFLSRWIRRG
ncbi:MAG TPA: hypothetical protein VF823_08455 [Anaerolineales bacterium]